MTDGRGHGLIALALAISVGAHVAMMFYMRPQVMTHVSGGGARARARAPMRVRETKPQPGTVSISMVGDVAPERAAPAAEVPDAPAAYAPSSAPDAAPDAPGPELPAAPDAPIPVLDVESMQALSERLRADGETASAITAPFPVETFTTSFAPATPDSPPPAFAPAPAEERPLAPPEPESTPALAVEPAVAGPEVPPPAPKSAPQFVPEEQVMAKLDEKTVEKEKSAVRDLLDVRNAEELFRHVSMSVSASESGGWTYFKVVAAPKTTLKTVPKDVVILMDASGSIANDRLKSCRLAAKEILRTCMNTGDRFNLVAFRDDFDYAFKSWRDCDRPSYEAAEQWMDRLAAHGRTDVFATIASVLKLPRDPKRPLIALVVTDGDANSGVSETSRILSKFTELNDGLVSVYMYGVKEGANRELIDVLTRGNRGESFIYGGKRRYAGRGIGDLSEKFRDPVLTDLRIVFAAGSKVEAYPRLLKNLYRGETVEIVGRAPAGTKAVSFSMKGLNGDAAYEGYFTFALGEASRDANLASEWAADRAIDAKLR